jgi:carboxyl-terminal processing protease
MKKHSRFWGLIILIIIMYPLSSRAQNLSAEEDYYLKIQKGLIVYQKVYEHIQRYYVEEIDPYEFMKAGIEGMLDKLDPYTVFIEQEGDIKLQIITTGKYGGLGMEIGMRNNKVTVISPMDNSPAKKAGIRAGDIIEKVDGESVASQSLDKISQKLRGLIGTQVEITLIRPGYKNEIAMKITREEITIEDVSYSDFVKPGIAYVRLAGFTEKASTEIIDAISKLKGKDKIKAFILDLRGNSGGLLDAAVEVAGIFLPQSTPVVNTIGFREGKNSFHTQDKPILLETPLAVLIDGGTASASEIVAGCFQDLDRAIIIGTDSFGKGLVQKIYPIDRNSNTKLKITTAKYYIPSGRCVQKQNFARDTNIFINDKSGDSLLKDQNVLFKTSHNRTVYGRGGISPDIYLEDEPLNYLITELLHQSLLFNFTVKYAQENPNIIDSLKINDKIFTDFISYIQENNFSYQTECEKELEELLAAAQDNNLPEEIIEEGKKLLNKINMVKQDDIQKNKDQIKNILLIELAEKYLGSKGKIQYSLINDKQLKTAIELLENEAEYKKILAIK